MWVLLALVAATSVQAQSRPSDIFVSEEEGEGDTVFESLQGFTAYGGSVGAIRFYGSDAVDGAKPRFLLQGNFRYRFSDDWVGAAGFGFGWNSFEARGDTVLTANFGNVSILREFSGFQGFDWRVGGGLGLYRWNYKFDGKTIRDGLSQQFYRGFDPGIVLDLEAERRITQHVTLTAAAQNHYIFSGDDKFDLLFDQNLTAIAFRLGVHYHFSPYEGILWDPEEDQGLTLGSGQAGP
jgi:hypothetical protein